MKNKLLKFILKLISLVLVITIPFFIIFIVTEKTSNQYSNTYLAEFDDKYDLLNKTDDKKIIFVGGSSLPFGLRSDLIEEELSDYKVINFGLYATLGTKFMMDMSKTNINEGDIVILSPEINEQTYSLYFNPTSVLQACDGYTNKYTNLSFKDNLKLFYNYWGFSREKLNYFSHKNAPNPIGIYRHDSFNSHGDISVDRSNNIMNNGVDPTMQITTTTSLLNDEFINYVNSYIDFVRSKKAKIYFNFSPCNELAISSSKKTRDEFQEKLDLKLKCDLLSNLEDCIIDYRYFYDTNFHLNSSGAIYYTSLLINNLKKKLNLNNNWQNNIDIPTPPELDTDDVIEPIVSGEKVDFDLYNGELNNDYVDYFEYRLVGSSYQLLSIKDEYKNIEKVILPSTYNGKNITTVVSNAFYGCIDLKEVYISPTYKVFEDDCFNGCISLEKLYLFEKDGNKLSPSSHGFLNGTSKNVKIYIPEGANYISGYTWSNYSAYFTYFKRGD